ncbi:VOC family protein [Marivita hallyeonensis]|uniref:Glyoxalase/Bleomycin resistance protein/Dioxygenase superfamily protein n=1 Tax=Marivita hallyeonensis TaxID=996342 RepID=A0A1M5U325_9RHOB|nr:VOC family protein [Marivita hallyeonensis]SHH57369.1 Glyoxalase/Bleomycin resistance protein/Dioxygenase superfamily protein [Marivita hallyeonensis]
MTVRTLAPMLPVADIDAARDFLRDCLGFEETYRDDNHSYCERDNGVIRLINAPPDADMDDPARQLVIYMDVDDADDIYAKHKNALEALPDRHFRAPFDRPYGQREFHAIHGPFLFMVGHKIKGAQ